MATKKIFTVPVRIELESEDGEPTVAQALAIVACSMSSHSPGCIPEGGPQDVEIKWSTGPILEGFVDLKESP